MKQYYQYYQNYQRKSEQVTVVKRLIWDGERCITLKEEKLIGEHVIYSNNTKFQLEPISREDLKLRRLGKQPGIVLKNGDELYYSKIIDKVKLMSLEELKHHKCGECARLSAKSDELGGCAKVRSIKMKIEYYDFIELGMQTFNLADEMLLVLKCKNYERY